MRRWIKATLILATLGGCAAAPRLEPATDALAPWTKALRDSQPGSAYAAVYAVDGQNLVFVAGEHATNENSETFRIIRDSYRVFDFDIVIVEGSPASNGVNASALIEFARSSKPSGGFQQGGETVPAVLGALADGAALLGGEPDDEDVRDRLLRQRFTPEDILGFYVLRSIPQWIGERKITGASDPGLAALVDASLTRNRTDLGLDDQVLPSFEDWARWYRATNATPIGDDFVPEETGPLADGPFGSNKIGATISRARDGFLHELVIDQLNRKKSVIVVFGGSHYLIHRPALEKALGPPCHVGPSLDAARSACTGR